MRIVLLLLALWVALGSGWGHAQTMGKESLPTGFESLWENPTAKRAILLVRLGEYASAQSTLQQAIARKDLPQAEKDLLRLTLGLVQMTARDNGACIDTCRSLMRGSSVEAKTRALAAILCSAARNDPATAVEDLNTVSSLFGLDAHMRAIVLNSRGAFYIQMNRPELANADFSTILEIPGASAAMKCEAHLRRSQCPPAGRDATEYEEEELTAASLLADAPPETRAMALMWRSLLRQKARRLKEATEDLTAITTMPGVANKERSHAFSSLAGLKLRQNDNEGALEAANTAVGIKDAPEEQLALAYLTRSQVYLDSGDPVKATIDLKSAQRFSRVSPVLLEEIRKHKRKIDEH